MEALVEKLVGALGLDTATRLGGAVTFFIYDSIKILLLLFFMISFIGFLRTYVSKAAMEKYLGGKNKFISSFFAALFAIFTPFCSCSSIPIFLSFLKMRVPFSAAICFLAVSPLINEYLVALMPGYYGLPVVAVYVIGGITIGMAGGWLLEKLGMERYLEDDMRAGEVNVPEFKGFKSRVKFGVEEGKDIVKKLWGWILVGVGIGAVLHNYVPDETVARAANFGGIFSVPIMAIVGAPVYASCAGVVPIAVVMFSKTLPLGTVLAFLMSASAMSIPEAVMLRRAMKPKLLIAFFSAVLAGIIIMGYFMNFISPYLVRG